MNNFFLLSMYAIEMSTGRVLIDQNSHLSMTPASCLKIVTTGAALHLLGPDHHFETYLTYDGSIDFSGTLHGNVIIQGGGDPCLGILWEKQLELWGEAVAAAGIRSIEGHIIGDSSKWEKALAPPTWCWEDLGNYFGAGASALSFHENSYQLTFTPKGLLTNPPLPFISFENEVTLGPENSGDHSWIYGSEYSNYRTIRGTIPVGKDTFTIRGSLPDPAFCCAYLLAGRLEKQGITLQKQNSPPTALRTILHTMISPSIAEIVRETNHRSMNLYAEHLLKEMGYRMYGEGSTKAGLKAASEFWASRGIDLTGFEMADGSGLSRKNCITTKQLVQMVGFLRDVPFFYESLPLKKEGAIRSKSGSMSLIRGEVGYAGDIAFAILINQCSDAQLMQKNIDRALTLLPI